MTKQTAKTIVFITTIPVSTIVIALILGLITESFLSVLQIPAENINHSAIWLYSIIIGGVITVVQLFRARKRLFEDL